MATAWVAGSVRARALARRRLGRSGVRALATSGSLDAALESLARSPYGRAVRPDLPLIEAQHGVGATLLWHLRVLAGWQPAEGAQAVRALAGWFEIANVEDRAGRLTPYRLGRLQMAWPRLAAAGSAEQLRGVLATSAWGDPGGDTPRLVGLRMRCAWAERAAEVSDSTRAWAAGGIALLLARERFAAGRDAAGPGRRAGGAAARGQLAAGHDAGGGHPPAAPSGPPGAGRHHHPGRPVAGGEPLVAAAGADGFALLRRPGFGPDAVVGAVAVLAADAWRVAGALGAGGPACDTGGCRCAGLSRPYPRRWPGSRWSPGAGAARRAGPGGRSGTVEVDRTVATDLPPGDAERRLQRLGDGRAGRPGWPDQARPGCAGTGRTRRPAGRRVRAGAAGGRFSPGGGRRGGGLDAAASMPALAAELAEVGGAVVPLPAPRGAEPPTLVRHAGAARSFRRWCKT